MSSLQNSRFETLAGNKEVAMIVAARGPGWQANNGLRSNLRDPPTQPPNQKR